MKSKTVFIVIGMLALGILGYFFGSRTPNSEILNGKNATEAKSLESQVPENPTPTPPDSTHLNSNVNSASPVSATANTPTPAPTAAFHNPLYDNPEGPADPNLVRQRDDEEKSLHELQHQVLPPADAPPPTPDENNASQ